MIKLDLHTHSTLSYDGGISLSEYKKILHEEIVHCIAITDHNEIDFALEAHQALGDRIIVGEEILAKEGEVIGLFIQEKIMPGLTVIETVRKIKEQEGVVYIPHPFDLVRHGMSREMLQSMLAEVDVLEVFNARSISQHENERRMQFAHEHRLPMGVGSDAHNVREVGKTYATIAEIPTSQTIISLLQKATYQKVPTSPLHRLHPFMNKLRKKLSL